MTAASRLAALLLLALATLTCGGAEPPKVHEAHGTVTAVDAPARRITIDHEDIPGFMVAMTMPFDLEPGVSVDGIEPGTAVDFEVRQEGSRYLVTGLRRAEPAASP